MSDDNERMTTGKTFEPNKNWKDGDVKWNWSDQHGQPRYLVDAEGNSLKDEKGDRYENPAYTKQVFNSAVTRSDWGYKSTPRVPATPWDIVREDGSPDYDMVRALDLTNIAAIEDEAIRLKELRKHFNVNKLFVGLTRGTCAHGHEHAFWHRFLTMFGCQYDGHSGTWFKQVADAEGIYPVVCFAAHTDTASYGEPVKVEHVIEGSIVKTDGGSILGADDRAGMTVLLWMILHNKPGLYCFFSGEEAGAVGANALLSDVRWLDYFENNMKAVIEFDRRGVGSIITEQGSYRTASDTFALALAKQFNDLNYGFKYAPDPTGSFTDSKIFAPFVSECTNISVGYYQEHSSSEQLNLKHLRKLCAAVLQVDWYSLPFTREPEEEKFGRWERGLWGKGKRADENENAFTYWNSKHKVYENVHGYTKEEWEELLRHYGGDELYDDTDYYYSRNATRQPSALTQPTEEEENVNVILRTNSTQEAADAVTQGIVDAAWKGISLKDGEEIVDLYADVLNQLKHSRAHIMTTQLEDAVTLGNGVLAMAFLREAFNQLGNATLMEIWADMECWPSYTKKENK